MFLTLRLARYAASEQIGAYLPQISDVHKHGCKIKWNPPKDDGGTPIDHFEVEKFDPETGIWMPAGRSDKPEIEVNNLTPGHEYKFRVKAVNAEGPSEPLEGTESIIAKNPFGELTQLHLTFKFWLKGVSLVLHINGQFDT